MVALSSSTVARSGVSMVAWTFGIVCWVFTSVVHANPNIKYGGDVSGDEVEIDQLEDYIRAHAPKHLYPLDGEQAPRYQQEVLDKIQFGVGPHDPRFYDPIERPSVDRRSDMAPSADVEDVVGRLPPYLPPNLGALRSRLESQLQFPRDVIQYPDDDVQYLQDEQYPDQYNLREPLYPGIRRPEMGAPFYNPRLDAMEDYRGEELPGMGQDFREEGPRSFIGLPQEVPEDRIEELVESHPEKAKEVEKDKKAAATAATSQPEAVNYLNRSPSQINRRGPIVHETDHNKGKLNDVYFTAIVAGCTAAAVCAVIGAGICWYRLNKSHRAAQDAEYPAYGVTGPNKDLSPSSGDRKLAQSAHMYHYQHQKQQMIALEKSAGGERHGSASDVDSEEEGEENEYTVYECPGLAPTGEMEVKNPLFHDDPTPATPSMRKEQEEDEDDDDDDDEEQKAK